MKANTTTRPPAAPAADLNGRPGAASASPPGRLRRRPAMVLMSVGLTVLGGVLGLTVWMTATNSVEVVAVRAPVDRGGVIAAEDLMVVRVSVDPAIQVVPSAQLQSLVGKRAASDLAAGSLVSPAEVTDVVGPATGESIVGIALKLGQLPAEPPRAGDRVRLVLTPAAQGEVTTSQVAIDAVVQAVTSPAADGQTVVDDLVVPAPRAPEVAALAGTGRVALVLDSRER